MKTTADSATAGSIFTAMVDGLCRSIIIGLIEGCAATVAMLLAVVFSATSNPPLGLIITLSISAFCGSTVGACVGAPAGAISFMMAGILCRHVDRFHDAMKSVRRAAIRGSVIGIVLGGSSGTMLMLHCPIFIDHDTVCG